MTARRSHDSERRAPAEDAGGPRFVELSGKAHTTHTQAEPANASGEADALLAAADPHTSNNADPSEDGRCSGTHGRGASSILRLLATFFPFAVGISVALIPNLTFFFRVLVRGDNAKAQQAVGLVHALASLVELVSNPVTGALSDTFGRKPLLMFSQAGFTVFGLAMAMVRTPLQAAVVTVTVMGTCSSSMLLSKAYIADTTPAGQRPARVGLLAAAFGAALMLGPIAGGWLAQRSARGPFLVGAGCCGLALVISAGLLEESAPAAARRSAATGGAARSVLQPLGRLPALYLHMLHRRAVVRLLAALECLKAMAYTIEYTTFALYLNSAFGYTPLRVGVLTTVQGLLLVASVTGGLRFWTSLGLCDWTIAQVALVTRAVIDVALSQAPSGAWFLALNLIGNITTAGVAHLVDPIMVGVQMRKTAASQQGVMQGAFQCMTITGRMVGALLGSLALSWAIRSTAAPPSSAAAPSLARTNSSSADAAIDGVDMGWGAPRQGGAALGLPYCMAAAIELIVAALLRLGPALDADTRQDDHVPAMSPA